MLDLEKYICKIANENNKVIGTGFFVLPDGFIVTCHHVIKGLKGNVKVGISSESELIKGEIVRDYETEDISVIKINREKCPFLLLSTESESGKYIFSHGFSVDNSLGDFPKGFPVKSILTLPTTLENGLKMFVLEETKVNDGLSGAPAVNDKGDVIGIIRIEYRDKALVIPIEYLFGKWSDLETIHRKLLQDKYQIKQEIDIPTIQPVLRKGETSYGDFFKNEPEWVDYEQGFIVERKEVSEIIRNLENENVQLVLGRPASGKSIILKNVGYKLTNENKNKKVYVVELKKHQGDDVKHYFDAIPEINDDNPIFIVDDAHLYPSECEKLIRDFKSGGNGKLIIGSRPTEDIFPTHPKKTSEFQFLNKTEIQAEDVTEEMIRTFLKIKHNFIDDRIKNVSYNLLIYKKDLWQLSWALKAYNPKRDSVNEEEFYEKIMASIIEIETKAEKTISAEEVFLPLSVFYRYEIPVERYFLEEQIGIEGNIINQLIGLQEIREIEETGKHIMLSLLHSSIAELYYGAYKMYPDFGRKVKKKILNEKDEKDLEFCSFYLYITTTYPTNAVDVVISLDRDFSDYKRGKTLLKSLIEEEKILNFIGIGINKEKDVGKIGRCLLIISNIKKEIASRLAVNIDITRVKNIMLQTDSSGNTLFLAGFSNAVKVEMELVEIVAAKVDTEEDKENIYGSMHNLAAYAKVEVAFEVLDMIDMERLSLKLDKEMDKEKVVSCVLNIEIVNKEVANKLINRLNPKLREELQKRTSKL